MEMPEPTEPRPTVRFEPFELYLREGLLHFGPDLYDRDEPLVRAVARAAIPDPMAVREAEALRRLVGALISTRRGQWAPFMTRARP